MPVASTPVMRRMNDSGHRHIELPARISDLLIELADEAESQPLSLGLLVDRFDRRGFGLLLLLVTLPTFLPLPVGAITGPLCTLIGLQMLLLLPHPWLPLRLRQRPIRTESLRRFVERRGHWLHRIERLTRPRWIWLSQSRAAQALSGLLIAINGILLSLPIPFTNYPLGLLLLLYCFALLERDGMLAVLAWVLGVASVVAFLLLSEQVLAVLQQLLG